MSYRGMIAETLMFKAGWMRIDTANVYFDHPYHAPLDHALAIDFICHADGGQGAGGNGGPALLMS